VYDYRCSPGAVLPTAREDRRSPDAYRYSNLGVQSLCSWAGRVDDSLDIISYRYVEGSHYPKFVGHFISFLEELEGLHDRDVVHGDIRFGNVVFSGGSCSSD
jgi:hypothetical protein